MARKDAVSDWSVTPNSNDNVGGINIAENCAAANLNNAIRTVMAQIKTYTLTAEPGTVYVAKAANYTAVAVDKNTFFRFTNLATLTLTAAATLANGWHCWIMADGGDVTVDPDGAETINGAASLTIIDGYSALLVCSGTAFYAVTVASQAEVEGKADALQPYISVASATTTDIGAVLSQNVTITGTTTITSFGTVEAGTVRNIVFSGALTLTHNATSLILPFGANITTAARAAIRAVSLGGGNWRVTDYQEAAAFAPVLTAGIGITGTGTLVSGAMTLDLDTTLGAVGTYAMASGTTAATAPGSSLAYADSGLSTGGPAMLGTWRRMGFALFSDRSTNWMRIV